MTRPSSQNAGGSYIDLIMTPRRLTALILDYTTLDDVGSDHLPTLLTLRTNPKINVAPPRRPKPDFDKADWDAYTKTLNDKTNELPYLDCNRLSVDKAIDSLTSLISLTASETIPTYVPKAYTNLLPKRIIDLIREKKRTFRDYKRYKQADMKAHYNYLTALIKTEIKTFKQGHYKRIRDKQTV